MGVGDYLRKTGGARRLVLMAKETVGAGPRHIGFDVFRVLGMGCCGAVTRLAGDPLVIAALLLCHFGIMAIGTRSAAGKFDLSLRVLHNGGRPVVTIEAKIGRDKEVPGYKGTPQNDDARYE
jgi:hypothetical protein